jgi:hypothetical protein
VGLVGRLILPYAVAVFVFFAATARARIISAYFGINPYRGDFLQLLRKIIYWYTVAFGYNLGFGGFHFTQIEFWFRLRFPYLFRLLLNRDATAEQEAYNFLVYIGQHADGTIQMLQTYKPTMGPFVHKRHFVPIVLTRPFRAGALSRHRQSGTG